MVSLKQKGILQTRFMPQLIQFVSFSAVQTHCILCVSLYLNGTVKCAASGLRKHVFLAMASIFAFSHRIEANSGEASSVLFCEAVRIVVSAVDYLENPRGFGRDKGSYWAMQ